MDKCKCEEKAPPLQVCESNAGHYVGRFCEYCGPYSRESDYYKTSQEADSALKSGVFGRDCAENSWAKSQGLI